MMLLLAIIFAVVVLISVCTAGVGGLKKQESFGICVGMLERSKYLEAKSDALF